MALRPTPPSQFFTPVIGIVCALLLASGWYMYTSKHDRTAHAFFLESLTKAGIPASDNDSLSALKLAYAKALAGRSPLMALAGTDPETMSLSVDKLEQSVVRLSTLQKDRNADELVRSSLYPIAFLRSMANLEAERLRFVSSGSDTDELAYETAQYAAIRAYKDDLQRFRRAFLRIVPADTAEFTNDSTVISRDGIIRALDELGNKISKTEGALRQRNRCLAGFISACDRNSLTLPIVPVVKDFPVHAEDISRAEKIRSMLGAAFNNPTIGNAPIIQLSRSACTESIGLPPLFVVHTAQPSPTNDATGLRVSFVGDLKLLKSDLYNEVPFFKYFADHGISYVYTPMSFYTCSETGYDFERVLGVRSVSEFSNEFNVSQYVSGTTSAALRKLERVLAPTNSILRESDAMQYLAETQALITSGALPRPPAGAIEYLSLQIANRTSKFDFILENIAVIEDHNVRLAHRNIPVALSAQYLFFTRSAFPLLFMSSNTSVSGRYDRPFKENNAAFKEQAYTLYSSLPDTESTRNKLIREIRMYTNLHTSPESVPTEEILNR